MVRAIRTFRRLKSDCVVNSAGFVEKWLVRGSIRWKSVWRKRFCNFDIRRRADVNFHANVSHPGLIEKRRRNSRKAATFGFLEISKACTTVLWIYKGKNARNSWKRYHGTMNKSERFAMDGACYYRSI